MAVALKQGRGENWIIQETLKQLEVKHCIKISVMNWDSLRCILAYSCTFILLGTSKQVFERVWKRRPERLVEI